MKTFAITAAAAAIALSGAASAQTMVGGAEMLPDRTIVENASQANNLTTLVAAVKQAGLVDTLSGEGPFTVFAPTDDAFAKISSDSLDQLMMDENKAQLANILTCHVVAADAMAADIKGMVDADGGTHPVETVGGCILQVTYDGDDITITDENGRTANVIVADVEQSNGVVHAIDTVLLPKQPE